MSPSHDSDSGIGNDAGGFTPSPETISQADTSETQANGSHASTTGLYLTLCLKQCITVQFVLHSLDFEFLVIYCGSFSIRLK